MLLQVICSLLIVVSDSDAGVGQRRGHGPASSSVPRVEHHITGGSDAQLRLERPDGLQLTTEALGEVGKWCTATSHEHVLSDVDTTRQTFISVKLRDVAETQLTHDWNVKQKLRDVADCQKQRETCCKQVAHSKISKIKSTHESINLRQRQNATESDPGFESRFGYV